MSKWIRLVALLLLMLLCLGACSEETVPSQTSSTPLEEEELSDVALEENEFLDPSQALILVDGKKTEFAIVIDNDIDPTLKQEVNLFNMTFFQKTGVKMTINGNVATVEI